MSVASRVRLLAGLAILALILAAFLMPPLGPAAGGSDSGPQDGTGDGQVDARTPSADRQTDIRRTPADGQQPEQRRPESERRDSTGSSDDRGVSLRESARGSDGEGDGPPLNLSRDRSQPDCFFVVWDELAPGRNVTIFEWHGSEPVAGQRVWFEDEAIGRTDDRGRVDGHVPYVRELALAAEAPPVDTCAVLTLEMETGFDSWRGGLDGRAELTVGEGADVERVRVEDGTIETTLPVASDATLAVEGEPRPGTEVRLNATVDGTPMAGGTVTVDGEAVGETDDEGTDNLSVPADGTEQLDVAVSRGEFRAETTIEVLVLSIAIQPDGLLALPGDEATVRTTIGDSPVSDAQVSGPTRDATTDAAGVASIRLPGDPRAVLEASAEGQTATAPVWPVYVPTLVAVLLGLVLVIGSLLGASRRESWPAPRRVAAGWAFVGAVLGAWVIAGPIAAAIVAGLGCAGLVVRYAETVRGVCRGLRTSLLAVFRSIHSTARWLADWLTGSSDRLTRLWGLLVSRLRSTPRSLRGLLAVLRGYLATAPAQLAAHLGRLASALLDTTRGLGRSLVRPRAIAATTLAVGFVAAGYAVGGAPGGLGALGLVVALLLARRVTDETTTGDDGWRPSSTPIQGAGGETGTEQPHESTVRQAWRTFARWVVPGRWRARTPGEVARVAVDRGFPQGPVERLTDTFREVEYGDRDLSDERFGRARSAFEALRAARTEEERGEQ